MANLSAALTQALSGLRVSSGQSAIVARNISRASEDGYSRKYAGLTTDLDGSARISSVQRNAEKNLLDVQLASQSSADGQNLLLKTLDRLQVAAGAADDESSISAGITDLDNKLRLFESNPASGTLADGVVRSAAGLAARLNSASSEITAVRQEADQGLAASVNGTNALLKQLEEVNTKITRSDTTDQGYVELLDTRDKVLKGLSSELGIRVVAQPNNGVSVYTDSGVTLFNQTARTVTFTPASTLGPGASGNAVFADGVAIAGPGAQMPLRKGKIAAYAEIRDSVAVTYQKQIDEVARGLVVAFAEKDASVPATLPDAVGLFTYPGAPAVPSAAATVTGLASTLRVNPAFDRSAGGNPMLLRDGGANGAAYVANGSGSTGFQQRIGALISALGADIAFASDAGLATSASVNGFAANSAGWIAGKRADANAQSEYLNAVNVRAQEALSRATGVNIDDEMSAMLNLERSYQASAKVITIVDQMFASLMEAVR